MKLPVFPQGQFLNMTITTQDQVLLYHTVLISAANLIPIPFVDDFIVQKIRQNMVKELGKVCGDLKISSSEAQAITSPYQAGCSAGCLFVFIYAIKELFREIMFWFDIQRSVSLVAETYCYGYLLAQLFSSNRYQPARAKKYGEILNKVISETETKLDVVKQAISKTFSTTKGLLKSISSWLIRFFWFYIRQVLRIFWTNLKGFFLKMVGRKLPDSVRSRIENADFKDFFEDKTPNIHHLLDEVAEQFQVNLKDNLVQQYLETLKGNMDSMLNNAGL